MKKQKFLSLLLSLVMVLALLPMSVFAADAGSTGGTASGWTVSKSKTATVLDSKDQTTVTLSLPSAQETLTSDVVFVLDKSSCKAETATAGKNMLNALTAYLASSNADIKIAVVAFDGTSHVLYELTKFTGSDEQIKVINDYMAANSIPSADKVSGTNMQAGLAATQKLLAADSDVASSHKYVVLVSDGLTRLFSDSNGTVKNIYTERTSESGTGLVCYGEMSTWELLRTKNGNGDYKIPYNNWDTYFANVKSLITTDGDNYAMDFSTYGNDATGTGYNDRKTYPYFKYIEKGTSDNHAMNVGVCPEFCVNSKMQCK